MPSSIIGKVVFILLVTVITVNFILGAYSYLDYLHRKEATEETLLKEKFNKSLSVKIKSMTELNNHLHEEVKRLKIETDDAAFLELATELIKQRFYYNGYSHYSSSDNALLFLLGKYVWDDLSAIVIPDDLLDYPYAACSQQSIVLMELLKLNGYNVRKVGLNSHFALEVKYKDEWYFFDPTFEPKFSHVNPRMSVEKLIANKEVLYKAYSHMATKESTDWRFENPHLGPVNKFPASRILRFHLFAKFYMKNLPYITFLYIFISIWMILPLHLRSSITMSMRS